MAKAFTNELARALARPDVDELREDLLLYQAQFATGGDWPDDDALTARFERIMFAGDDPDLALAYLSLSMAETDDRKWLGYMAAGPLENLLSDPSEATLTRILAEARRTPRFRWLLSGVWLHAIAEQCRAPIAEAVNGWSLDDTPIPPRPWA